MSSYTWTFGDATSTTTSTHIVTHTYPSAGTFVVHLTETNGTQTAAATGTIKPTKRPVGTGRCTESIGPVGAVTLLQMSGPQNPTSPAPPTCSWARSSSDRASRRCRRRPTLRTSASPGT